MTYQRKTKPAPWVQAGLGGYQAREPKKRKPVRRVSTGQSKRLARYHARARVWKSQRTCCGWVLKYPNYAGQVLCESGPHKCEDVHHMHGKLGPLLMDERHWLPVCRKLHDFIRDNPAEAKRLGLLGDGPWNTVPRNL